MHFRIHWSHADMKGNETEYLSPWWSYLWSSRYHSKEAGGTAIASQRKMAVLPKWAGMFFMSVIMGGSGGGHKQTEEKIKQLAFDCVREKSSQVDPAVRWSILGRKQN